LNLITFMCASASDIHHHKTSRLCAFCDRGTHQFQARCPASRSRPSPIPGAALGSRRGPAFWWARPSCRVDVVTASAAWSGRAIVTRMGGDARLARGSGARPMSGRALERDPSPSGEGRPQTAERSATNLLVVSHPRLTCLWFLGGQPSVSSIFASERSIYRPFLISENCQHETWWP
jgi:hypothetical protein